MREEGSPVLTGGCIAVEWLIRRGVTEEKRGTHLTSLERKAFFDRLSNVHAPVNVTVDNVDLWDECGSNIVRVN